MVAKGGCYFTYFVIILRGRWCHIIVLSVHAPTEDKTDDVKDSFYEELERVFDKFPKYHMLGDFNFKVGREDIIKLTNGNESLHKISNDNGVRIVNIATHNQIDYILVDRRRHSNVLDVRSFRAANCDTDHYLVVAKVKERLAANKQRSHGFHMERFDLKKQRRKLIVLGK
jgi:hypothetical protein